MNSSNLRSESASRKSLKMAPGNGKERDARDRNAGNVLAGRARPSTRRLESQPASGSALSKRARLLIAARSRAASVATRAAAELE